MSQKTISLNWQTSIFTQVLDLKYEMVIYLFEHWSDVFNIIPGNCRLASVRVRENKLQRYTYHSNCL